MNTAKLLNDKIINLDNLLLNKGIFLKLTNDQVVFILKIIPLLKDNKITEKEIFKKIIIKKKELDNNLAELLRNKYIKSSFKKSENNVIFDFIPLWDKLLNFYKTPKDESSIEEKVQWFTEIFGFESDSFILETLDNWIKERDWLHIVELTNKVKLSNLENVSWNTFVTIHDKLFEKSTQSSKKAISDILNFNWLEE